MSRTLEELTDLVAKISDLYAERMNVERDDDWFILKLQEELGELTAEHLRLSGRGRLKGMSEDEIKRKRDDEAADLLAMMLLYARHNGIDLNAALDRKWFAYFNRPD